MSVPDAIVTIVGFVAYVILMGAYIYKIKLQSGNQRTEREPGLITKVLQQGVYWGNAFFTDYRGISIGVA